MKAKLISCMDSSFDFWVDELLRQGMFVDGWFFERLYRVERGRISDISIVLDDGQILGVAICWRNSPWQGNGWSLGVYVHPIHRRKGIGRIVAEAIGNPTDFSTGKGIDGSSVFWAKVKAPKVTRNIPLPKPFLGQFVMQ